MSTAATSPATSPAPGPAPAPGRAPGLRRSNRSDREGGAVLVLPSLTTPETPQAVAEMPKVPGPIFHASPAVFEPGTVLRAGVGRPTVGDGSRVCLAGTLEQARRWAVYLGRRVDADRVRVYRVRVEELTSARLDLSGALPLPECGADAAVVEELVESVDPWEGVTGADRDSLRAVPF